MDYKQKYKEALNRAKSLTIPDDLKVAKYIFHELKESDDEKIRKKVIEVLKLNIKGAESQMQANRGVNRTFEVYACNKVISWLEKQKTSEEALEYLKENHSVDEVNDFQTAMNIAVAKAFDAGRNSKLFINKEDEEMINLLIAIFEINYPNDIYKFNPVDTTDMKGVHSFEIIDWLKSLKDRVHLKQEWNKEDKEMYKKVETAIDSYYAPFSRDAEEMSKWFKNLKDRVQPQSKQEWNKEDEERIKNIISVLDVQVCWDGATGKKENPYQKEIDWLKSLRPQTKYIYNPYKAVVESIAAMVEKYAPFDSNLQDFYENVKVKCKDAKEYDSLYSQNTWKPSDRQMKALKEACDELWEPDGLDPLYTLWEQLKKLKEE